MTFWGLQMLRDPDNLRDQLGSSYATARRHFIQKFEISRKQFKEEYLVRNFEKCILSIILYIEVKHLENLVTKFQDDWSRIDDSV